MPMTIFMIALRQNWRKMLAWGMGLGVLSLVTVSFVPTMDILRQYEELFKTLPAGMLQAFGIDMTQQMTPDSFVASFLFSRMSLLLAVYAVLAGLSVTINEEDDGIMDSLITLPIPRWRLVTERLLAHAVMSLGIVILMFVGLYIGTKLVTLEFNTLKLLEMSLGLLLPVMVIIASTVFIATALRYRSRVLAAAAVFVIGSYFLDALGGAISDGIMPVLRRLSFFAYNDAGGIVQNGTNWADVLVMSIVIAALFAGSLIFWERRDIGL